MQFVMRQFTLLENLGYCIVCSTVMLLVYIIPCVLVGVFA